MLNLSLMGKPVTDYDLRLLRIFIGVVNNNGYTAAESELGITRSTISVHMTSLETRMNLRLCDRGRGGFKLTEEGQQVYNAALKLFEAHDEFSYLVQSMSKELSGEIVILCSDQLDNAKLNKLAAVVDNINAVAPNLHLVFDGDTLQNIEKAILSDQAHAGILPPYKPVEGLEYQDLFDEPMYLCCGKSHPLYSDKEKLTIDTLSTYPAIHPGLNIDTKGRKQLHKLKLLAKAYQFDTRRALVLSGRYIGYFPESYIDDELKVLNKEKMKYRFKLSLAYKRTPKERRKIRLIKKSFSDIFAPSI